MQPAIEIVELAEADFTVSVGIGHGTRHYECDALPSMADCLIAAADALGNEFRCACVTCNGVAMGSFTVERLHGHAGEVADELASRRSALESGAC